MRLIKNTNSPQFKDMYIHPVNTQATQQSVSASHFLTETKLFDP